MIHFPALRWGTPYRSLEIDKVSHFDTGEAVAEVSQANPGIVARDMRKAGPRPACAPRAAPGRSPADGEEGRGAVLHGRAAARRRHADAGRVRPAAVRHDRAAGAHVPDEHGEAPVRARPHRRDPGLADAPSRPRHSGAGLRGRGGRDAQLSGHHAGAGDRAALELAGRAQPVAADHPAPDRAGAQAGTPGALDAVADDAGVLRGGGAARGGGALSGARRGGARRCSTTPGEA